MLAVTRTVTITRPPEVVRSQFADVGYHERSQPHRGARFVVLEESATECVYEQVTGQGPLRLRQRYRLGRRDPAHLTNTVIAGPFRGGSLVFAIDGSGPDSTVVTAVVSAPGTRATRLAAPLLRRALGRSLQRALGEDKADIESGSYERQSRPE
jgi:hypothetical protein